MNNWVVWAVLTATFYGGYNFLIKVASGKIDQIAGAVILQVAAAVLGGIALLWLNIGGRSITITRAGIGYAILAGLIVGMAEITSFYVFSKGVPTSIGVPMIIGGSVVAAAILGALFLGERLNFVHAVGMILIIGGIVLLAK